MSGVAANRSMSLVQTGYADSAGIFAPGSTVRVYYAYDDGGIVAGSKTVTVDALTLDLLQPSNETLIEGATRFTVGTRRYQERGGVVYTDHDPATGLGVACGAIDYGSGRVNLTFWNAGETNNASAQAMLTELAGEPITRLSMRTPGAPIRQQSFQLLATLQDGTPINITADANGLLDGPHTQGEIEIDTGVVTVLFGQMVVAAGNEGQPWYHADNVVGLNVWKPEPVLVETVRFNAIVLGSIPLSASILGLDPVRLPVDGRVPIFKPGYAVVVHNTANQTVSSPSVGTPINLGRARISRVRAKNADGSLIAPANYSTDLDTGTLTFSALSGVTAPITLENTVEDMSLCTDAEISGRLSISRPLSHTYPTAGSYVSSALVFGDLFARYATLFDQQTWTNVWSDALIGSGTSAEFNDAQFPIAVSNRGAIQERWAVIFNSATDYRVIGEAAGQIATGNTVTDCSPVNPATGVPYFSIPKEGWGSGWSAGNVLRFNTFGANAPVWIARTIAQSAPSTASDSFRVQLRGNVDNP